MFIFRLSNDPYGNLPRPKKVSTGHFFYPPYGRAGLFDSLGSIKKLTHRKVCEFFW